MRLISRLLPAVVAVLVLGLPAHQGLDRLGATAAAAPKKNPAASSEAVPVAPAATIEHGQVYVLRGLANIWSRGLDQLGKQLEAKGVRVGVYNHTRWPDLVTEIIDRYGKEENFPPVIVIGHSLGANASVLMAEKLGQAGVPVRLMVTFDSLSRSNEIKVKVSSNVQEVLNFYKGKAWGLELIPGKGFTGKIENVNLQKVRGVSHYNMDKNPELQARVVSEVLAILAEKPAKAASN